MTVMDNPPVTMEDFFETSRGLWLIRRVVHHLDSQDDEAADSNLVIEPFNASDDAVEKVCKVFGIERCWFVNDQIRMRVNSVQFLNGAAMTTYCTEFRCPSKADIEQIANQAKTFAQTNPL